MINENPKSEIRNPKLFAFILRARREVQNIVLGFQPRTIMLVGLIKKPIIRVLFLGVLLLIVLFTSVEVFKNPNVNKFGPLTYPTNQEIGGEKLPPVKLTFSFPEDTKIPNTINVYKIVARGEDENRAFFDKISQSLGATTSAQIKTAGTEKSYTVTQNNFYFSGNLSTGYFSFSGKSTKTLDTADEDGVRLSAWDFLFLAGMTSNVSNAPTISYNNYLGGELAKSANTLLADAISLSYQPSINNVPLLGLGSTYAPLQIFIDKKNKYIFRLDYAVPLVDTKTAGNYDLLSPGNISRLGADSFTYLVLVDKNGDRVANLNLDNIVSVNFQKISLNYYITPKTAGLLQPVFLLNGNATLKDGRSGIITALLPAAKNINPAP